ncbi:hypothetical protein [Trichlorobacter lovleyi]|jgi:hypothetical protein|uniref:Transmembrane protein n=1 Tax=Trichlorobacter lovleyi (strain ATCC BAA-1151 / DSM 17278 / SZ) TaxID=398767 RepID=B3E5N5_TRIL1|nr:hypothetical protein [Trichlorobacter lovleyi]ACD94706.1 hypothetical protein Glov_0983 [Trichlorobacter lovleyi SZ]
MPVFVEAIMVVLIMLACFFGVFLLLFLFALALFPVEKSLSKMVWDMTAPPRTKQAPQGGFKGFSEKHRS